MALKKVTSDFDENQRLAYAGLSSLPERILFLPGGPGSGKTWWALTLAVLAQAGVTTCRVLYLVDINKPVDDAANRMYQMCRDLGVERSVVRVMGWPLIRKKDDSEGKKEDGREEGEGEEEDYDDDDGDNGNREQSGTAWARALKDADLTEGFLRAMKPILPRDEEKAPTLDEKAWEMFQDQPEKFSDVDAALSRALSPDRTCHGSQADMEVLRQTLIRLYYDVLSHADFIATTPVTAPRLSRIFHPDLVIFDESAHARELSTMIPLAWFQPRASFYIGDFRQTEPFSEAVGNKYALQLKTSTMERAEKNKAVGHQLLVNHRAHGGLERLASELFYDGAMRSEKIDDELSPPSVNHLRQWLKGLTVGKLCHGTFRVPRLIISLGTGEAVKTGTSSSNFKHMEFVMKQVDVLLHDRHFIQVGSSEPGTIMILSPYKEAVNRYQGAVNRLPTRDKKRRVQVRTADTAQGQEADVVFLDMVRSRASSHTDNPKRLCVSITRARQAEVIMMMESMATTDGHYMGVPVWLRAIWEKCDSGEEGAILHDAQQLPKSWGSGWAPPFGNSSVPHGGW